MQNVITEHLNTVGKITNLYDFLHFFLIKICKIVNNLKSFNIMFDIIIWKKFKILDKWSLNIQIYIEILIGYFFNILIRAGA